MLPIIWKLITPHFLSACELGLNVWQTRGRLYEPLQQRLQGLSPPQAVRSLKSSSCLYKTTRLLPQARKLEAGGLGIE